MSLPPRQHDEQQRAFLRRAAILRKNLVAWDATLHSARGEDWPSMLGRLNAAFNQAGNLDRGIDDASEHIVYVPRRCTTNPGDVSSFLSTRLVAPLASPPKKGKEREIIDGRRDAGGGGGGAAMTTTTGAGGRGRGPGGGGDDTVIDGRGEEDPTARLRRYERSTAELASEFEDGMVRF